MIRMKIIQVIFKRAVPICTLKNYLVIKYNKIIKIPNNNKIIKILFNKQFLEEITHKEEELVLNQEEEYKKEVLVLQYLKIDFLMPKVLGCKCFFRIMKNKKIIKLKEKLIIMKKLDRYKMSKIIK